MMQEPGTDDTTTSGSAAEAATPVYDLRASALPAAVSKIEAANRRASKAGIDGSIGYDVEPYEKTTTNEAGLSVIERRVKITLTQAALRLEGWDFVATLTWDAEAGLVTRVVPGETLAQRPEEKRCDVCGSARWRKNTFVVRGVETDGPDAGKMVEKQVGSNCLARFFGIKPSGLWLLDFDLDTVAAKDEAGGYGGGEQRFDVVEVLALALHVVGRHGWVARSASSEKRRASADLVSDLLAPPRGLKDHERRALLDEAAEALVARRGDAVALREFAASVGAGGGENDSEYLTNMRAVAGSTTVAWGNLGLLVSAVRARVSADERARERAAREAENAARLTTSAWVGKEGDKVVDVPVTVARVSSHHTGYGYSRLVILLDEEGRTWKAWYSGDSEIDEGAAYLMRATIKGHEEYQDVKQTVVTRLRLAAAEA